MTPVVTGVLLGATVVAGKWAKGKAPNIQNGVGVAGVTLILAFMAQANADLASKFAWLILLGTAFVYVPDIVKASGLGK